ESTPRPMAFALMKDIPGVVNAGRMSDEDRRLLFNVDGKSLYAAGRYADPSLFSMFTFQFIEGNSKNPFPQLYSLVLTEKAAIKFFGKNRNVTGQIVRINNLKDYVVSGVIKDLPENSSIQFEWIAPYEIESMYEDNPLFWGSYGPFTY